MQTTTLERLARLGATYAVLDVLHDLADHVGQTDWQAAHKADYPDHEKPEHRSVAVAARAMAGHVGGYHAIQLAGLLALRAAGVRPSWARTAAAVALSAGTHALLDRRWPVVEVLRRTRSAGFAAPRATASGDVELQVEPGDEHGATLVAVGRVEVDGPVMLAGPYLADQALHRLVLLVAAALIAGGPR